MSEAFALLGLSETASLKAIKDRYHAMASDGDHRHPDRGGDAGEFTRLVEAHKIAMGRVCPTCGGKREVYKKSGFSSIALPCPECAAPEPKAPRAKPARRARR